MEREKKRHFVLVHGACHGAWCWYKVAALLKSGGHEVTALDMAASGIHPKEVHELNSISEYLEPLMELLRSLAPEERVILVGHSLGGVCISEPWQCSPARLQLRYLLPLGCLLPNYAISLSSKSRRLESSLESKIFFDGNTGNHRNGYRIFGPQSLASNFYQLSPPEDLTLAMTLLRPTRIYDDEELLRENTRLTRDNYGTVAKVYIVCEHKA
ncbi:Methylesterase 3 [Spatholobus suberectus]|nr:Methylesterase 3 [Spatholobus suberectus]